MTFLPIVTRELAVVARRPRVYGFRVGMAALAILVMAGLLVTLGQIPTAEQGRILFSILSTGAFVYCILAGVRVTSDCMSAEKRDGTLGLLFLTDLKGYDVVLGKIASSSLHSLYGLLAILPVSALALLLGGLTGGEVIRISLALVNTLFLSLSAGAFVSTISQNERKAMFGTIFVLLVTTLAPLGIGAAIARGLPAIPPRPLELAVLAPSPIFTFMIAQASAVLKPLLREFFTSLVATHLLGWAFLGLASRILPKVCQDRPRSAKRLRWRERFDRWSYGESSRRETLRARMLDRNPFYWLAGRDRLKTYNVWAFLGAMAVLWFLSFLVLGNSMFDWPAFLLVHTAAHGFLKIWVASEVCSRLVEDRRSGAFELLLSSPLTEIEIERGQSLALWRQFGKPILFLALIDLLFLWRGMTIVHYGITNSGLAAIILAGLIVLPITLWALKWVAMWRSLLVSNLNRAILATVFRILVLPWAFYWGIYFGLALGFQVAGQQISELPAEFLVLAWLVVVLTNNLLFGLSAKRKFLHNLRTIATQGFRDKEKSEDLLPMVLPQHSSISAAQLHATTEPMASTQSKASFWRLLLRQPKFRFLLIVVGLCLIVAGSMTWFHASLKRKVNARLGVLQRAGHPTTLGDFQKLYPPVPLAENAAAALTEASYFLVPADMVSKAIPAGGRSPYASRTQPLDPDIKQELLKLRARNGKFLEMIRRIGGLEKNRYVIDLTGDLNLPNSYWRLFMNLRKMAHVLELQSVLASEEGRRDVAIEALDGIFAISRSLNNIPLLDARWQRIFCLNLAFQALERLLTMHALSDEELRHLSDQVLRSVDKDRQGMIHSFQGQLFLGIRMFGFSEEEIFSRWMPGLPRSRSFLFRVLFQLNKTLGVLDREFILYLDAMTAGLEAAQVPFPEGLQRGAEMSRRFPFGHQSEFLPQLSQILMPPFESLMAAEAEASARLRCAEVVLAIERSRLENEIPKTLGMLSPRFLNEIPSDPFDGAQLRYKLLDHGYVVYSIGRDLQDGGGQSSQGRAKRGDDISLTVER